MKQETSAQEVSGRGKHTAVWYAVIAVIGIGLVWFIVARVVPKYRTNASNSGVPESPLVLAGKNTITLDDQLFGDSVTIKSIDLASDSWVAIHEDLDGKPGNILGAAWFPAGVSSGVVELQRPTVDGATYYAMLHADKQPRGEDGHKVFDFKVDVPLTDESGEPLMVKFMTTAHPAPQQ